MSMQFGLLWQEILGSSPNNIHVINRHGLFNDHYIYGTPHDRIVKIDDSAEKSNKVVYITVIELTRTYSTIPARIPRIRARLHI